MLLDLDGGPLNPSSVHTFGQKAKQLLARAREKIAHHLDVDSNEIIFTSGGTESMNLLIRGSLKEPRSHIISSPIEHASVHLTLEELQKNGAKVTYLPIDQKGAPRPSDLEKAITEKTTLIVLSAANGETGVKLDLEACAKIAQSRNVPLIIDGVALLGKEPFPFYEGISGVGFSAHKLHGPKGIGCAIIRGSHQINAELHGGGQENHIRSGTENLSGILGFAKAIELAYTKENQMKELRDYFEASLKKALPGVHINGTGPRLPNTSNLYFENVDGESLSIALDMEKIAVSQGSACSSGALEPSRVLLAMGHPQLRAKNSLRFSLSRLTTKDELNITLSTLESLIKKLRNF